MLTVGIDIGGTKIAGGVVDASGGLIDPLRVPTPRDPREIEDAVVAMITDLSQRHPSVGAVGIAAAGFIDRDRSVVTYAANIAWRDEPLRARIEPRVGLPVVIENDANAAGWAEYRFGAGSGTRNMIMLTIGTGIGGAVITEGALYRGGHGSAGELGHMRFQRDGLQCGCGQHGCIEQYASGRALQRIAGELADAGGIGSALAAARESEGTLDGRTISGLVSAGDSGAIEALRRISSALGEACGTFQAAFDPELFVIGGGVSQLGEILLAPMREAYATAVPAHGNRPGADFAIARLVNDAGVIGVGDLAREGRH
ncbi:ROK family glucokinase [Microbacterium gorillae]|uniref:ROK family glucokinase n=1 Tax=Microbacterium gorillae TaxID=1231063 RepID=UPI00058E85C9|nr:ROK family glucokinase [Microbacterium gorillae]